MQQTSELIWQDTQHQVLFELIDEIRSKDPDTRVFDRLNDYAQNHFSLEEVYMRELGFPGTEVHVRAHDRFRAELKIMLDDRNRLDSKLRETMAFFLSEWLKRHIFGIDKELEAFVLESTRK